jgi:hypothetical protein
MHVGINVHKEAISIAVEDWKIPMERLVNESIRRSKRDW